MNPIDTSHRSPALATLRGALVATAAMLAIGSACAQNYGPSYAGGAIGSTDYGTGLKVFLGGKVTPIFGWEGQIVNFGSENYGAGYKRSAWALGGSATARFPFSPSLAAFGKGGLHYVRPHRTGPGGDPDSSIELGLGLGLMFNFSPTAAMRLEYENIGGSDGSMASFGLQFSF